MLSCALTMVCFGDVLLMTDVPDARRRVAELRDLRCMKFELEGRCNEILGQTMIPLTVGSGVERVLDRFNPSIGLAALEYWFALFYEGAGCFFKIFTVLRFALHRVHAGLVAFGALQTQLIDEEFRCAYR